MEITTGRSNDDLKVPLLGSTGTATSSCDSGLRNRQAVPPTMRKKDPGDDDDDGADDAVDNGNSSTSGNSFLFVFFLFWFLPMVLRLVFVSNRKSDYIGFSAILFFLFSVVVWSISHVLYWVLLGLSMEGVDKLQLGLLRWAVTLGVFACAILHPIALDNALSSYHDDTRTGIIGLHLTLSLVPLLFGFLISLIPFSQGKHMEAREYLQKGETVTGTVKGCTILPQNPPNVLVVVAYEPTKKEVSKPWFNQTIGVKKIFLSERSYGDGESVDLLVKADQPEYSMLKDDAASPGSLRSAIALSFAFAGMVLYVLVQIGLSNCDQQTCSDSFDTTHALASYWWCIIAPLLYGIVAGWLIPTFSASAPKVEYYDLPSADDESSIDIV